MARLMRRLIRLPLTRVSHAQTTIIFTALCRLHGSPWMSISCEKHPEDYRNGYFYFIKAICLRISNIIAHSNINISQFLLTDYRQVLCIGTVSVPMHRPAEVTQAVSAITELLVRIRFKECETRNW